MGRKSRPELPFHLHSLTCSAFLSKVTLTFKHFTAKPLAPQGHAFSLAPLAAEKRRELFPFKSPMVLSQGPSCPVPYGFTLLQLFLQGTGHIPTSGPLHLPFFLPGTLLPWVSGWLPLTSCSLCSKSPSQETVSGHLVESATPTPPHQLSVPLAPRVWCGH